MTEAQFQTKFNTWLKYRFCKTGAFELKVTHETSIPFSALKDHQCKALTIAQYSSLVYKIPDDTMSQKPFDCFILSGVPAYVVIMFYKRAVKHFYLIDIDRWMLEKEKSKRRSLTEERAKEIGEYCEFETSSQ